MVRLFVSLWCLNVGAVKVDSGIREWGNMFTREMGELAKSLPDGDESLPGNSIGDLPVMEQMDPRANIDVDSLRKGMSEFLKGKEENFASLGGEVHAILMQGARSSNVNMGQFLRGTMAAVGQRIWGVLAGGKPTGPGLDVLWKNNGLKLNAYWYGMGLDITLTHDYGMRVRYGFYTRDFPMSGMYDIGVHMRLITTWAVGVQMGDLIAESGNVVLMNTGPTIPNVSANALRPRLFVKFPRNFTMDAFNPSKGLESGFNKLVLNLPLMSCGPHTMFGKHVILEPGMKYEFKWTYSLEGKGWSYADGCGKWLVWRREPQPLQSLNPWVSVFFCGEWCRLPKNLVGPGGWCDPVSHLSVWPSIWNDEQMSKDDYKTYQISQAQQVVPTLL